MTPTASGAALLEGALYAWAASHISQVPDRGLTQISLGFTRLHFHPNPATSKGLAAGKAGRASKAR